MTPMTHIHTHTLRGECTAAGKASILHRKSRKQIPIAQQAGMMQLPIRSSAGGRLSAQQRWRERMDRKRKEGKQWGREALGMGKSDAGQYIPAGKSCSDY